MFAIQPPITVDATGTVWIIADGLQPRPEKSVRQYVELQRCDIEPIHLTRHQIKWRLNSRWTHRKPKRSQVVPAGLGVRFDPRTYRTVENGRLGATDVAKFRTETSNFGVRWICPL